MTNTDKSTNARTKWLLAVAGLLVVVGALSLVWVPYQRQMWLIEELEGMRQESIPFHSSEPRVKQKGVGPDWLRELVGAERMRGFDPVVEVLLDDVPIDDAWLERLGRLSGLEFLRLNGARITDEGLKHLAGLSELRTLSLIRVPIGDEGLKHLAGMTQLKSLSVEETRIGDDGLQHLTGLTNLEWLSLDGSQIGDAGLKHLVGLSRLRVLSLYDTQISDDGVMELQRALPDCDIWR